MKEDNERVAKARNEKEAEEKDLASRLKKNRQLKSTIYFAIFSGFVIVCLMIWLRVSCI